MRTAQNLEGLRHSVRHRRARNHNVGRTDGGALVKAVAWLGHTVIHSTALCHVAASLVFAIAFAGLTIGWDRTPPFDYLPAFSSPTILAPGQSATIRFRIGKVHKICSGEFERWFIDSEGTPFPLGTFQTVYQNYVGFSESKRYFDKDWTVPLHAAAGPGIYESRPRFWCNPMQYLYPIEAARVRVMVNIVNPIKKSN